MTQTSDEGEKFKSLKGETIFNIEKKLGFAETDCVKSFRTGAIMALNEFEKLLTPQVESLEISRERCHKVESELTEAATALHRFLKNYSELEK